MKRTLFCFITCILLLCLTACNQPQSNMDNTAETSSVATTTTVQDTHEAEQLPMYAISLPVVTETESATDGTTIFKHTYQNISLVIPEPEVADKIILDFLNITDLHSEAEALKNTAEQEYTANPESFSSYWVQSIYNPTRIDRGVLSLYGSYATYSGGAHGAFSFKSANYDLVTGEPLDLDDIFAANVSVDEICNLIIRSLKDQKEAEQLFDDFETIVLDLIRKNFPKNHDWFFSADGLCFFFSPYEIGPFASADVVAVIPYDSLIGILDEAYFPAEREHVNGTVQGEIFDESKLDDFTQFAEITVEENSDQILLYTNKSVYDVIIKTGSWSADGKTYTPEYTLLVSHTLTPGDALMIENALTQTLPSMQLSYTTNDQTVQFYIGTNSNNNTVILTEN